MERTFEILTNLRIPYPKLHVVRALFQAWAKTSDHGKHASQPHSRTLQEIGIHTFHFFPLQFVSKQRKHFGKEYMYVKIQYLIHEFELFDA
jgi:hypothetical protein